MKLFPGLLKALAAGLAVAAPQVVAKLVEYFSGPTPSDVSGPIWALISIVAVFVLNFLVGKLPAPKV